VLRSTNDALVKAGVLADDRYIAAGAQRKAYTNGNPGALIVITVLQP